MSYLLNVSLISSAIQKPCLFIVPKILTNIVDNVAPIWASSPGPHVPTEDSFISRRLYCKRFCRAKSQGRKDCIASSSWLRIVVIVERIRQGAEESPFMGF